MQLIKIFKCCLILLFFIWNFLSGQNQVKFNSNAEKEFYTALQEYKNKDYADAANLFENLVSLPFHQRTTASLLMLGKIYIHLNHFEKAVSILNKLLHQHPKSNYVENAFYTMGMAYFGSQKFEDAVQTFLKTLEITKNTKTTQRALAYLEQIVIEKITEPNLISLIQKQTSRENKILLKLLLAKKQFRSGEFFKARATSETLIRESINTKYHDIVMKFIKKIERGFEIKIAALLPLMKNQPNSHIREVGEELLKGIQFAIDEYNTQEDQVNKIVIEVYDTEQNIEKAVAAVKELSNNKDVLAIIGPVFSNEVLSCAPIANESHIPLITPTATANGLAAIGDYIFQANPDYKTRSKALAYFAVKELGLINLAVISPDEPINKSISENFIEEVRKLGGNIIDVQWYNKNALDLSEQFKSLRKTALTSANEPMISFNTQFTIDDKLKLINAGASPNLVDSILSVGGTIGVNRLFGVRGSRIADSLKIKYFMPSTKIDSLDIPVTSIHGIFFPIAKSEEISIILPQLHYYNIQTQILGSSEWYDERQLDYNAANLNSLIFLSESFIDYRLKIIPDFLRRYQKQFSGQPTNNFLYGYDVMLLITQELKKGSITRENLRRALSKIKRFQGIHSKITLQNGRVNSEVHILKYIDKNIIKIGEVSVNGN